MNTNEKVLQWAKDRNLVEGSTPEKQFLKLSEEMGELAMAMNRNDRAEQIDAVGDMIVVLTVLSAQLGFRSQDAFDSAYAVIKDRKGRMMNGVFVKEEDISKVQEELVMEKV